MGQGPFRRWPLGMRRWLLPALPLAIGLLAACGGAEPSPTPSALERGVAVLEVTSPAFQHGGPIPIEHTCDGANVSPPLELGPPPPGARSLALIMDDPDATGGVFSHWLAFNLQPGRSELEEGLGAAGEEVAEGLHGVNDFGRLGYDGPCPPPGPAHTYRVLVFALDRMLAPEAGASAIDLLTAMRGNVLALGQLEGVFGRGEE